MFNRTDQQTLASRYTTIAASNETITSDIVLRDLEVNLVIQLIDKPNSLLDVGCGYGETSGEYAKHAQHVTGIDICEPAIEKARSVPGVTFEVASILDLSKYRNFDVITSHRCLMALLDWDLQTRALEEMYKALAPRGKLILFEGLTHGLYGLNNIRKSVGLAPIPGDGRDRLMTLRLDQTTLSTTINRIFGANTTSMCGFDTYYLLTRVYYPLIIFPDEPSYNTIWHTNAAKLQRLSNYDNTMSLESCIVIRRL